MFILRRELTGRRADGGAAASARPRTRAFTDAAIRGRAETAESPGFGSGSGIAHGASKGSGDGGDTASENESKLLDMH